MRLVPVFASGVVALGLASAAVADEATPLPLAASALDRVTAGAFAAASGATADATSSLLAVTTTGSDTVIRTDDDPAPGSLQPTVGATGGTAVSWTATAEDDRSAGVSNAIGGDGYEVARIAVGGSSESAITTIESQAVLVATTVRDPYLLRP